MQAFDKNQKPIGDPTPLEEEGLKKLLENPDVDHVKVFRLKKDDVLTIRDARFQVTKVLSGGRAVIKRRI